VARQCEFHGLRKGEYFKFLLPRQSEFIAVFKGIFATHAADPRCAVVGGRSDWVFLFVCSWLGETGWRWSSAQTNKKGRSDPKKKNIITPTTVGTPEKSVVVSFSLVTSCLARTKTSLAQTLLRVCPTGRFSPC
jgi:hypothetical protein